MNRLVRGGEPGFLPLWNGLMSEGGHLDALYGVANLAYYHEYSGCLVADDVSFLVTAGSVPLCGLRAFSRRLEAGQVQISCFGLPVLYAERHRSEEFDLALAHRLFREEVDKLLLTLSAEGGSIRYKDRLPEGSLSAFGRLLLDRGGVAIPSFSQIIDLSLPEEKLHKGLTKAYKWAVNWAKKNMEITVLDRTSIMAEHIEQFRLLHVEAAGRETRTAESWALQYEMVRAGEAFCVFASLNGALVSAALFPHSRSHCYYGVSASRRDLFDKPLSHGVIWTALLHAKWLGLSCFEMGEQLYPMAPLHNSSHKDLGISFFKRAFGGTPRVFLDISLQASSDEKTPSRP